MCTIHKVVLFHNKEGDFISAIPDEGEDDARLYEEFTVVQRFLRTVFHHGDIRDITTGPIHTIIKRGLYTSVMLIAENDITPHLGERAASFINNVEFVYLPDLRIGNFKSMNKQWLTNEMKTAFMEN